MLRVRIKFLPMSKTFNRSSTLNVSRSSHRDNHTVGFCVRLTWLPVLMSTIECGGPRVYSYEELLKAVAHEASLKPKLIPIPFAAWHVLAWFAEMLPSPPVTRNQVELMQVDIVASPEVPGFGELGISPLSIEEILPEILWDH